MGSDLEIVNQAKTDCKQFQSLYRKYLPLIFNYCLNRLGNKHNAEDVTSAVFFSALDKIQQFNKKKGLSFKAWLFSIAHNKIIDFYKKHKDYSLDLQTIEKTPNLEDELNEKIILEERQKEVIKILSLLKPNYQQILTLKFYAELSNPEIAEVMNVKQAVLNNQLHRALESFEKKFKEIYSKSDIFTLSNRNN